MVEVHAVRTIGFQVVVGRWDVKKRSLIVEDTVSW